MGYTASHRVFMAAGGLLGVKGILSPLLRDKPQQLQWADLCQRFYWGKSTFIYAGESDLGRAGGQDSACSAATKPTLLGPIHPPPQFFPPTPTSSSLPFLCPIPFPHSSYLLQVASITPAYAGRLQPSHWCTGFFVALLQQLTPAELAFQRCCLSIGLDHKLVFHIGHPCSLPGKSYLCIFSYGEVVTNWKFIEWVRGEVRLKRR